jgi:hypothetical protein
MTNPTDERLLWKREAIECVMISCCDGAELQLRRRVVGQEPGAAGAEEEFEIILRELYPTKSDLYERSRALALEH